MNEKFIRVYKKLDIKTVKKHLLIYGDLSANCANCKEIDIKLNMPHCPKCETEFKYVAFRNVKTNLPRMNKIRAERPSLTIIDIDDYNRNISTLKADNLFK